MSIDARISAVIPKGNLLTLRLRGYKTSDGTMSIAGRKRLVVVNYTRRPVAGQMIWGDAGQCIVEAGNGGGRIEYRREGTILREKESEPCPV